NRLRECDAWAAGSEAWHHSGVWRDSTFTAVGRERHRPANSFDGRNDFGIGSSANRPRESSCAGGRTHVHGGVDRKEDYGQWSPGSKIVPRGCESWSRVNTRRGTLPRGHVVWFDLRY